MARNQMLRRLGWEFIRVRGSDFFRGRAKVMKKLERRLQEVGIVPLDPDASPVAAVEKEEDPLPQRVIKRAELIRNRWKDIPTPSDVRKAASGE